LKKSMKWDEDTFGLEYDLDIYNIVAVSDFSKYIHRISYAEYVSYWQTYTI